MDEESMALFFGEAYPLPTIDFYKGVDDDTAHVAYPAEVAYERC